MMKRTLLIMILTGIFLSGSSGLRGADKPDTSWFEDARFGMFVHFGPYSVLGAGEWVMNNRPIRGDRYMKLQELFNPQAFDAREWVRIARDAGMKYITFTSRHHDGFSNWATRQSDWNIMNTPYGKDMLRQLSDECQAAGIKLVLYYSLIDWMRPDYQYETGRTGQAAGRTEPSDWNSYIGFVKAQLTELLTEYEIAGIWFDGHWDQTADKNRTDPTAKVDWHYPEIYDLIHTVKPGCLVANNHHLPPLPGEDYQIFERDVPGENTAGHSGQEVSRDVPLETCQTINKSWGFNITDDNYKPVEELIRLLVRTAGTGANLLLNVAPMPDGRFDAESIERLEGMGQWMDLYGHTIYGTKKGFIEPQTWGAVTGKEKVYYIHILDNGTDDLVLDIPGIKTARLLTPGRTLEWNKMKRSDEVSFTLSGTTDQPDTIIEVTIK